MNIRKIRSALVVAILFAGSFMVMVSQQRATFTQSPQHNVFEGGRPVQVVTSRSDGVSHAALVPESIAGLKQLATNIVVAKAIASKPGEELVFPGSPTQAEVRLSTQYITFEVQNQVKGSLGKTFVLWHQGNGIDVPVDPMYTIGETYLLFVEPDVEDPNVYMVLTPEGRYRQNKDGTLTAISKKPFATAFNGKTMADLTRTIAQTAEK